MDSACLSQLSEPRLSKEEIDYFKKMLTSSLSETRAEIERLKQLLQEDSNQSVIDSAYAYHIADAAANSAGREWIYMMIEHQIDLMIKLEKALERIRNNSYGLCRLTGKPITRERLLAVPYADVNVMNDQHA